MGGPTTPEQRLAAAILAQAFTDMFDHNVDTVAVDAMRYLTARHGKAAYWRNKWCSYLDQDGDVLAERVRKMLDGEIAPPGHHGRFASRLGHARSRWAGLPQPTPKQAKRLPEPTPGPLPKIQPAPPQLAPQAIDIQIPDDPFYVASAGHIRVSRRWHDGETSRFLGPLPPQHSKLGEALWAITQTQRAGANAMVGIYGDTDALIEALKVALPHCEIRWSSKGERLPEYQRAASLRVYLKQLAKVA